MEWTFDTHNYLSEAPENYAEWKKKRKKEKPTPGYIVYHSI